MEINWKAVLGEYIYMQIYIFRGAQNKSWFNQRL